MTEELLAEVAAMGRLIARLAVELERLNRQFDRTEKAALLIANPPARWRGRDDEDDASD